MNKKIFRIFVSSTFSDMKAERAILQEDVFKRLKKDCRKRGAIFQDIDLRWGVTEEAAKTHQTMKICLSEIARCQNISPKPNFIVLLGDRYGWQPLPAEIPADEALPMMEAMSDNDLQFFYTWYKEDTNAVPPLFVLQERPENADEWAKVEESLQTLLRAAANKVGINPEQKKKYFASATHQEIICGALNPPAGAYDPKEHVFCYFRKTVAIADKDVLKDYIDLDEQGNPNAYCRNRLDSLKKELGDRLPDDHIHEYPGVPDGGIVRPERPKEFADRVYENLKGMIFKQLDEIEQSEEDALTQEIARHNAFAERAVQDFTGRGEPVAAILSYLGGTDRRVYALVGESGSGKTTVMARAAHLARKEEDRVIVTRFLGTTGEASNFESLITQIDEEIANVYSADISFMRGTGDKRKMEKDVFRGCLMLAGRERPLVIFIDALDQLSPLGRQLLMDALPKSLPTYCKIVISGTTEVDEFFSSSAKELLLPMTKTEGEALLTAWFKRTGRTLRDDQERKVIGRFLRDGLPLYLKLLFENARQWHSYDSGVTEIAEDMEGIMKDYFHCLELQHTKELVATVMGYFVCSRHGGLPENEVLEILAGDEDYWSSFLKKYPYHSEEALQNKQIPVVIWSRLYLSFAPYLTERTEDGAALFVFYHRQFKKYAQNAYVKGREGRYYRNLGEYGLKGMRLCRETGISLGYTALYGLVYCLQAGFDAFDAKVRESIVSTFLLGVTNAAPIDKLSSYAVEEGCEEERKRYENVIGECCEAMAENAAWGGYLGKIGGKYKDTVFKQQAIFCYQKAITIGEGIYAKNPACVVANGLASHYGQLGSLMQSNGRLEEAERYYEKAITIGEEVRVENPNNIITIRIGEKFHVNKREDVIIAARHLASNYGNLGSLLGDNGKYEEAEYYFQKAIASLEEIHAEYVKRLDDLDIANDLAINYCNFALLLHKNGRLDEAERYYQKAIVLLEEIHAKNPNDVIIANGLSTNLGNLGVLLLHNGSLEEAERYFPKAIAIGENSHSKSPDDIVISNGLAANYGNFGLFLDENGRLEEAEHYYQMAIALLEEIHTKSPDDVVIVDGLASNYGKLGSLLYLNGRQEEAESYYKKAIAIAEESFSTSPYNIDITDGLFANYGGLGSILQKSSRLAEAEPLLRRMVEVLLTNTRAAGRRHQHLQSAINIYAGQLKAMGKSHENILAQLRRMAPEFF